MQLQFLGENFDASNCGRMCDNCKNCLKVVEQDMTKEALKIIELVQAMSYYKNNITTKMTSELMKGKKLQKSYIRPDLLEKYQGSLRHMGESEIRRLIIKLLIMGALEESFIQTKIKGVATSNISVYLVCGKQKRVDSVISGVAKVKLSHGIEQNDFDIKSEEKEAETDKYQDRAKFTKVSTADHNLLMGGGAGEAKPKATNEDV